MVLKIIKRTFDRAGFEKAVKQLIAESGKQTGQNFVCNPMALIPEEKSALMMEEAVERIGRANFEIVEELVVIGTVAIGDNPHFVVYDATGDVKTVNVEGCTVVVGDGGEPMQNQ